MNQNNIFPEEIGQASLNLISPLSLKRSSRITLGSAIIYHQCCGGGFFLPFLGGGGHNVSVGAEGGSVGANRV